MIERERSFDISKLSKEEADNLASQLGNRVQVMVDETANKINGLLAIYGMRAKFQCVIEEKNKPEAPKKRRRKPKQS